MYIAHKTDEDNALTALLDAAPADTHDPGTQYMNIQSDPRFVRLAMKYDPDVGSVLWRARRMR